MGISRHCRSGDIMNVLYCVFIWCEYLCLLRVRASCQPSDPMLLAYRFASARYAQYCIQNSTQVCVIVLPEVHVLWDIYLSDFCWHILCVCTCDICQRYYFLNVCLCHSLFFQCHCQPIHFLNVISDRNDT